MKYEIPYVFIIEEENLNDKVKAFADSYGDELGIGACRYYEIFSDQSYYCVIGSSATYCQLGSYFH